MNDLVNCLDFELLDKLELSYKTVKTLIFNSDYKESETDSCLLYHSFDYCKKYRSFLSHFVADERKIILPALEKSEKIVIEGAQ